MHDLSSHAEPSNLNTSLRGHFLRGSAWIGGGGLASQLFQFAFSVVLSRLLLPAEFGLAGMVLAVTSLASMVMTMGMESVVIAKHDLLYAEDIYHTAFSVQVLIGAILTLLLFFGAPLFAAFYGEPQLLPLFRLASFVFVLIASYTVVRGQLRWELRFSHLCAIDVIGSLLGGGVGIVLASRGAGVYSLLAMLLAQESTTAVGCWLVVGQRPKLRIVRAHARELFAFCAHMVSANLLNRSLQIIDNILVGKYLTAPQPGYQLGIYSRAFSLMAMPVQQVNNIVYRVLMPVLSHAKAEPQLLRSVFVQSVEMVALITFPLMAGMGVTARHFVPVLFGPNWNDVVPIVQILAPIGAIQILLTVARMNFILHAATRRMLALTIPMSVSIFAGFIVGVLSGSLRTFALIYLAIIALWLIPFCQASCTLIEVPFKKLLRPVAGIFLCTMPMTFSVWYAGVLLEGKCGSYAVLAIQVATGVLSYVLIIHLFRISAYRAGMKLLWETLQRRTVG